MVHGQNNTFVSNCDQRKWRMYEEEKTHKAKAPHRADTMEEHTRVFKLAKHIPIANPAPSLNFYYRQLVSNLPNNRSLCVALYTCLSFCNCWLIFLFVSFPRLVSSWSAFDLALPKHPITLGQPMLTIWQHKRE